jgi:hypothetical protein
MNLRFVMTGSGVRIPLAAPVFEAGPTGCAGLDLGDDPIALGLGVLLSFEELLFEEYLSPLTCPRFPIIQDPTGLRHDSPGAQLPTNSRG